MLQCQAFPVSSPSPAGQKLGEAPLRGAGSAGLAVQAGRCVLAQG